MFAEDDEIDGSQLCYISMDERNAAANLLDGLGGGPVNEFSLRKDKVAFGFMTKESEHLEFFGGKKKISDQEELDNEYADFVVRWKMPKQNKHGFFTLFGVHLLKKKKQVTNNAIRIQTRVSALDQLNISLFRNIPR